MKHLALLVLAGCVHDAVPARFADKPIVTKIDDERPIARPTERLYWSELALADAVVFDPSVDVFDPVDDGISLDVNALDEVPDSTWFTNRIGIHPMTPDEVVKSADTKGPPEGPYVIVHAKSGGGNPGFIATDKRGIKYLFKFDTAENPGQQTATDNIVQRIFWAIGYHTPADFIVHFKRSELTISPKLHAKKIDDKDIDLMLVEATQNPKGVYRATASEILDGEARGPFAQLGTREDDPNDRIPHERRRVLRGLRVFGAWVNNTDIKDDNGLDMYVDKHLVHYLVDFGEAFGGHQSEHDQLSIGYENAVDWSAQPKALFAFGLWERPWEAQRKTKWPQIGYFSAVNFDPRHWHVFYPYRPFHVAAPADLYWGAKLVMKFDRPMLEALVANGELDDPDAAKYLVETLIERQRRIGATYLDGVTPFDEITLAQDQLCGTDLGRFYKLAGASELLVDGVRTPIPESGKLCKSLVVTPGYHIVHLQIRRPTYTTPVMELHYIGGDNPHIVGILR
ncbi:MAG: hypothetical protein QM831_16275 [Kofleriaceae bacterium]